MAFCDYNWTIYGSSISSVLFFIFIIVSTATKDRTLHSTVNNNFHTPFQWNVYYFKKLITQNYNSSDIIYDCNYQNCCQGGAKFGNLISNREGYQDHTMSNGIIYKSQTGYHVKKNNKQKISYSGTDSVNVKYNDTETILLKKNITFTGRQSTLNKNDAMVGQDSVNENPDTEQIHYQRKTHNFTLVSALFDLHREKWPAFRRRYNQYLNYSIPLLQMEVPLVAFIDSAAELFVRKYRKGKENITHIVVTRVEELEYYEDYDTIKNIMDSDNFKSNHTILHHPEGFSPEYNILMNSKFSMLNHAANQNYFNSSHFYWIDMGYGHGSNDVFPKSCDWAPRNIMYNKSISDKITYIQINNVGLLTNIYQIYKTDMPPFLSGGFFGGSKSAVQHYYHIHREMFKLFLLHKMIDDDQTLAILCYFKTQSLFHFVDGWWYDAFKLFN